MEKPATTIGPVIVLYNKPETMDVIKMRLDPAGIQSQTFLYGPEFMDAWDRNRHDIHQSVAIIIHEDLGSIEHLREYRKYQNMSPQNDEEMKILKELSDFLHETQERDTLTCQDVITRLRKTESGESLRFILGGNSFSYHTSQNKLYLSKAYEFGADGGYDPSEHSLPEWLVDYISIGRVTKSEANEFRGKSIVENQFAVNERRVFIEQSFRGKERE
jgi:hypothetical protein